MLRTRLPALTPLWTTMVGVLVCVYGLFVPADAATPLEPCIHDSVSMTGTVHGIDGLPAQKALVSWHGVGWDADCRGQAGRILETRTDSSGVYTLRVPAGRGTLSIEAEDRYGLAHEFVFVGDVRGDVRRDHRFRIFRVEGRVFIHDGATLPAGEVLYYPKPHGMICGTGLPTCPIKDGHFTAILRSAGDYVFALTPAPADSGIPYVSRIVRVDADTTLTFLLDGFEVHGVVRGWKGQPLANAGVVARSGTANNADLSDERGNYRMYLPPGSYEFSVGPKEGWIQPRNFGRNSISSRRHLDFDLPGVELSGQVRNAATGEGVDSIEIYCHAAGADAPFGNGVFCMTGPEGQFRFVVRRGWTFDAWLRDYRVGPVVRRLDADPLRAEEQIEREYARVRSNWVKGVVASGDSTFNLSLVPVSRKRE